MKAGRRTAVASMLALLVFGGLPGHGRRVSAPAKPSLTGFVGNWGASIRDAQRWEPQRQWGVEVLRGSRP